MSAGKRDYRIDGIKFLLICLVIIGHYIEPSRYKNDISETLYSLIYMLHMPLFVMISGYFCNSQSIKKLTKFSIQMLEVIVIIVAVSYLFINSKIESVFNFSTPLWFILSLIYWKWYSYLSDILKIGKGFQVIISCLLAICGFIFINDHQEFLSVSRAIQFIPYFSLGRWISNKKFNFHKSAPVITLSLLFIASILLSSRELHLFEFHREGIENLAPLTKLPYHLCFIMNLLLGIVTAIASIVLITTLKMPPIFEKYGKYTLTIFCFHCYSYPLVVRYFHTLNFELLLSILSILLFAIIARKEIVSKLITNPVSLIVRFSQHK